MAGINQYKGQIWNFKERKITQSIVYNYQLSNRACLGVIQVLIMSSKLSEVRLKKTSNSNQSLSKLTAGSGGESTYLTLDNYIARNCGNWCSRYGD